MNLFPFCQRLASVQGSTVPLPAADVPSDYPRMKRKPSQSQTANRACGRGQSPTRRMTQPSSRSVVAATSGWMWHASA